MSEYRRAFQPGGMFFLTLVTNFHEPILASPRARQLLRSAINQTQIDRPFAIEAIVFLPDHLHCIWTLPNDDADFSTRIRLIKGRFTHAYLKTVDCRDGCSASRQRKGERGVWHRRFWEHSVRDDADFERICGYIHYNPVKHGHANCPHAWPFSSFHRYVKESKYERSWGCVCDNKLLTPLRFKDIEEIAGE